MAHVGILGGTFNPPHLGHLAVAAHAHEQLGLEPVVLIPARIPPHKDAEEDPGPEHRLRMCRLAVEDSEGLSVCAIEIKRSGPSYTVDTLNAIHASHPDARLTFIVGADTASTLPAWREPTKVLELADLAVASRAGSDRRRVLDIVAPLRAASSAPARRVGGDRAGQAAAQDRAPGDVSFLDMPMIRISSSMARRRAALGEPIEAMVGPTVARYISEHGLYREAAKARS